jgi:Xaa-Pro aminopeptidase
MEKINRIEVLRKQMMEKGIEAALIEDRRNREYLIYADIWEGSMIITQKAAVLLVDFRYYEMAAASVRDCEVQLHNNIEEGLWKIIRRLRIHSICFEKTISYQRYVSLQEYLDEVCLDETFCMDSIIKENRKRKDNYELSCLRTAQEITDCAYEYILTRVKKGMKESEIRIELGSFMIRQGSEGFDIGYISSSGTKTSLPHGGTGDKIVESGDLVMIDFGAVIGGYHSDCTRTFAVGSVTNYQREVYEIVHSAQKKALEAICSGVRGCDIDRIARDYIDKNGYRGCFEHGLGHSIGLEGHENPRFNQICQEILYPNTVMTVEPGIYLEHDFGIRIEDMGVITKNGFENFTKASKELIII